MNISNYFMLKNIFSEKIRKKMINDSKELIKLRDNIWFCPDITTHKNFKKTNRRISFTNSRKN